MNQKNILSQLYRILNNEQLKLSYEQRAAISEAIEIIENKGALDPAWIAVLIQALGIAYEITIKAP